MKEDDIEKMQFWMKFIKSPVIYDGIFYYIRDMITKIFIILDKDKLFEYRGLKEVSD